MPDHFPIIIALSAATFVICFFILFKQQKCEEYSTEITKLPAYSKPYSTSYSTSIIPRDVYSSGRILGGVEDVPCAVGYCKQKGTVSTGTGLKVAITCVKCAKID